MPAEEMSRNTKGKIRMRLDKIRTCSGKGSKSPMAGNLELNTQRRIMLNTTKWRKKNRNRVTMIMRLPSLLGRPRRMGVHKPTLKKLISTLRYRASRFTSQIAIRRRNSKSHTMMRRPRCQTRTRSSSTRRLLMSLHQKSTRAYLFAEPCNHKTSTQGTARSTLRACSLASNT